MATIHCDARHFVGRRASARAMRRCSTDPKKRKKAATLPATGAPLLSSQHGAESRWPTMHETASTTDATLRSEGGTLLARLCSSAASTRATVAAEEDDGARHSGRLDTRAPASSLALRRNCSWANTPSGTPASPSSSSSSSVILPGGGALINGNSQFTGDSRGGDNKKFIISHPRLAHTPPSGFKYQDPSGTRSGIWS
ncbi:hypothetical protein BC830DRAFT_71532 [Chytriomyces sp. MP71]|nr:hypothetical protein BC830DRAFT_71532 [Chytriomyces sp. MP71]